MTHDIDLTSPQWTALVFEGRNKEYGAYEMRNDSSDRHLKALIIITLVGLAVVFLPNLLFKSDISKDKVATSQITDVTFTDLDLNKKDVNRVVQPILPPLALKPTIQYVTPVVVPDEFVDPNQRMATQIELTESNAQISTITVVGVEGGTVDAGRDLAEIITEAPPKKPLEFVEQMPRPNGGMEELMRWLSRHIQYPALAVGKGIQGRVIVRFVVQSDGSIDDVTVVKSLEPSCDKEAVRAVKSMPQWIPGRQNGVPVSVYYTLPIQFRLEKQ
jgi:protein TonB